VGASLLAIVAPHGFDHPQWIARARPGTPRRCVDFRIAHNHNKGNRSIFHEFIKRRAKRRTTGNPWYRTGAGSRVQRPSLQLFWVWFAANISILGLPLGATLVAFRGLAIWQAIIVAILGAAGSFAVVGSFPLPVVVAVRRA
jgi:hypothetical protein